MTGERTITGRRASSTTGSAPATRTRSASRRSSCCSTPRRGISCSTSRRVLAKVAEGAVRGAASHSELMQSVVEITTPVCRSVAEVGRAAASGSARTWPRSRAPRACRYASAGTHPFSFFERQRITAKDRYRRARRADAVHRPPRADLRHAHPHRRRRPGQGDGGHERAAAAPRGVPRALGQLAVLARRADGAAVVAADDLLGVPALGRAAALLELRRVRGADRPARAHRRDLRLHAHLVGHPRPREARHGRAADLRRRHERRRRGRDRRLLPGAREALLRAVRRRHKLGATTGSSPSRTSSSPRATASRRR